MPDVVITERNGSTRRHEAAAGESVMRVALEAGLSGIEAVCGGVCACGTCHVYVGEAWLGHLPPIDETEDFMLDETEAERRPNSRLSCQILLDDRLSGIEITIPPAP